MQLFFYVLKNLQNKTLIKNQIHTVLIRFSSIIFNQLNDFAESRQF